MEQLSSQKTENHGFGAGPLRDGNNHAEAFCLMRYATKDGRESEIIWNSRDGVTPFGISSRQGKEMFHEDWHADEYKPDHVPKKGDRVFVDITQERFNNLILKMIDHLWDDPKVPMSAMYKTKDDAFEALTKDAVRPGDPDLVIVDVWPLIVKEN